MGWLDLAGTLLGGYMTSQASKKAAKQQRQGLDNANDLTWQMYQQTRADNAPARALGNSAIGRLSSGFGFNSTKAASQDVIPAKISVPEAQVLKNLGGAGVQDPRTGFWHFYNERGDGTDGHQGAGDNDAGGRDGTGGRNDSGRDSGGGNDRDSNPFDGSGPLGSFGNSPSSLGSGNPFSGDGPMRSFENGSVADDADGTENFPSNWSDPENPAYQRSAVPGFTESAPSAMRGSVLATGAAGLAGLGFTGDPSLAAAAAKEAWNSTKTARSTLGNTAGWNSIGGVRSSTPSTRDSGNDNGSAQTWGSTFGSYPTTTAQTPTDEDLANATGGYTSTGDTLGDFERDFNASNLYDDPSYQWRVSENLKALDKSAAAKGTLFSGQYIKDLSDYVQGNASQEYSNAWNRYQTNRGNKFNMLASMAGLGQTATGNVSSAGLNAANLMGNNYSSIGNANAAGTVGSTNAWTNALNNWQLYQLLGSS